VKRAAVATVIALTIQAAADPAGITFDDAIRVAIANNPDARIAVREIERVEALLSQATAALIPQVRARVSYTRLESDRSLEGRLFAAANSVIGNVGVTGPVVDPQAWADRRRAADQRDATTYDAQAVKRAVAIAAARAYFQALTSTHLLEIAQTARQTAAAHVAYAVQRKQGGVGTDLDVSRAQTELATDEALVASAKTALLRADEALGVITGSPAALAPAGEPLLSGTEGLGIASRADLRASAGHREAAQDSADLDWAQYVPALRIDGAAFVDAPVLPPVPRIGYDVLLTLEVPIFEGGLRRARHAQHLAELGEAREREVGTVRLANSEVAVARTALANTRAARDAAHRAADLAAKTLDLANTGYVAGTVSELDVIDAQRAARDDAVQAALADDDYREAELDLLAATGAFPPP
jgi:outer membrane protein TolC